MLVYNKREHKILRSKSISFIVDFVVFKDNYKNFYTMMNRLNLKTKHVTTRELLMVFLRVEFLRHQKSLSCRYVLLPVSSSASPPLHGRQSIHLGRSTFKSLAVFVDNTKWFTGLGLHRVHKGSDGLIDFPYLDYRWLDGPRDVEVGVKPSWTMGHNSYTPPNLLRSRHQSRKTGTQVLGGPDRG